MDAAFPHAIVHVDGDAFFAACEQASDVHLQGRPVVTGLERGIVSSATYDAKKKGVARGVSLRDVRKLCPEAAIVASDFELYAMYSRRMYAIVRRYARVVEEYGIDECFGDITGADERFGMSYAEIAQRIKDDLYRELRITFSVGLAPTKVLAKLGSKHQKPDGLTVIALDDRERFLRATALSDVWGIGPRSALLFYKQGLTTALEFAQMPAVWVADTLDRPYRDRWNELNGIVALSFDTNDAPPHSIQCTRTFTPPSKDTEFIIAQLSRNIEIAARKARRQHLVPRGLSFYLKSQTFEYQRFDVPLPHPTAAAHELVPLASLAARSLIVPNFLYRATGVTLYNFRPEHEIQLDFWQETEKSSRFASVYEQLDRLTYKYGTPLVQLASSMRAAAHSAAHTERIATTRPFIAGIGKKRLPLPVIGEV